MHVIIENPTLKWSKMKGRHSLIMVLLPVYCRKSNRCVCEVLLFAFVLSGKESALSVQDLLCLRFAAEGVIPCLLVDLRRSGLNSSL